MNIQILRKNQSSGLEPIFTGKKQYIRTIIFDSKEKLRDMGNLLLELLGFVLIFIAVNWKRNDYSEIKIFSLDWFITILLVGVGVTIIKHYGA